MSQAILFDRDRTERLGDVADRPKRLRGSELLWVDVDRESEEDADRVADAFGLDRKTRDCLATLEGSRDLPRPRPLHPRHDLRARTRTTKGALIALECVVGERWVVTAHDDPDPGARGVRRAGVRLG